MEGDVFQVLKLLTFSSDCESLREQRDRLFLMSSQELLPFLLSLEEEVQLPSLPLVRDCAYHYVFMGAIALKENHPYMAFRYCLQAVDAFRCQNDFYNEALALWLAGIACARDREIAQARRLYQTAIERIQQWASLEDKERDETYLAIRDGISKSISALRDHSRAVAVAQPLPSVPSFDFLALPSFPLFAQVQAGPDGPIWGKEQQVELLMDIRAFSVGTKEYTIFSLHRGDHRIFLQGKRSYGWVVVHGDSMNAAEPVPIVEGDLALFYVAADASENDFVIISCPESAGSGYQYMVKRWKASQNLFLSESTSGHYPPIPRDKEHRILGVVIAVAKPLSSLSSQESDQASAVSSPQPGKGSQTKQKEKGYAELVSLVGGKKDVADRLIEVEQKRDPKSSRSDCISRAIAKLLHDRQP